VTSKITGRIYDLWISLPANYGNGTQRFPVLYVLDGAVVFGMVRDILFALQGRTAGEPVPLPPMIIVAITCPERPGRDVRSEGFKRCAAVRQLDLTPTVSGEKAPGKEVSSGGAQKFLGTMREEIFPMIEANYRTTKDRGLVGSSLGGLFATYVLFNSPDTFSRYLIGSPSLWWDNGIMFKQEARFASDHRELPARVFLSVGADEGGDMIPAMLKMADALKKYGRLELKSHIFENETHFSVIPAALSRGMRFLYRPRSPQAQ